MLGILDRTDPPVHVGAVMFVHCGHWIVGRWKVERAFVRPVVGPYAQDTCLVWNIMWKLAMCGGLLLKTLMK